MGFDNSNGGNGWADHGGVGNYMLQNTQSPYGYGYVDQTLFDDEIEEQGTDWGTLLGAQGPGGQRANRNPRYQAAPAMQMQNPMGTLQSLMAMAGQPRQNPRPGNPYMNRYVSGLMQV